MKNRHPNGNPFMEGYYLTDGGLETTLIFNYGYELPHFAAFELLNHAEGRNVLQEYYEQYLTIAQQFNLHFVLETPTWRANRDWGFKLGYTGKDLERINWASVAILQELKLAHRQRSTHYLLSGTIGPRGDGYVPGKSMSALEAKAYHSPQIRAFKEGGVDMVTAMTFNYSKEAIGLVWAAQELQVPSVISFTVETDGHLPNGETLQAAIEKTDQMTSSYAAHFMINCAHPGHFREELKKEGVWKYRIRGIRANASTKSHAELDESENLDAGDKCGLANDYLELMHLLPELKVIGGCCGTDHSHIEMICGAVFAVPFWG